MHARCVWLRGAMRFAYCALQASTRDGEIRDVATRLGQYEVMGGTDGPSGPWGFRTQCSTRRDVD
jgi:hypothetical protein